MDDGKGDLGKLMGLKEPMRYYPISSLDRKGEFDIAVHENSFINKTLFNQKAGFPMRINGPIGSIKFIGRGSFYK